jgi:DNA-directed RNA polymerase specialized sigma24 family protein
MSSDGDSFASCQAAARRLIADLDWRLLTEAEFAARAAATLAERPEMTPLQACQHVYALTLYAACQNDRRQEQAYAELHDYLYRIACRRRPELAEDAAQEAIELIFRQIHTCREPGAFLCFAWYKLLQAIQRLSPRREKREEPLTDDDLSWSPADGLLSDDDRVERLWRCIRLIWQKRPRAHDQLRALLWKQFDGLSIAEIAERSHKTPDQVYVLISRALAKLRECMTGAAPAY